MPDAEAAIRLSIFFAVLAAMASWEWLAPRRPPILGRRSRWPSNLGIVFLDGLLVRLIAPAAAVGFAHVAETRQWGVLSMVEMPFWLEIVLSVLVLDLALYLQHVLFHAIPMLWRLHRMHHSDVECDVTTGLRFHPVEILVSLGIKLAVVAALGPPIVAVLLFEVLLNASSMFNHGNVRMPIRLDRMLRLVIVTPDMHRVHHSVRSEETNSNFGFNLPWWDRLFGTYRPLPADGHAGMTIGIGRFLTARDQRIDRLLLQPFVGDPGPYPIGRRSGEGD